MSEYYHLESKVLLYPGMDAWHFLNVPKKESEEITRKFGAKKRGWGSLPVTVTILRHGSGQVNKTSWKTSIFPDKRSGTYVLPLKAEVREKEHIKAGMMVAFSLRIEV